MGGSPWRLSRSRCARTLSRDELARRNALMATFTGGYMQPWTQRIASHKSRASRQAGAAQDVAWSRRSRMTQSYSLVNGNLWLWGWTFAPRQVVFRQCWIRQWATMAKDLPGTPWGPSAGCNYVCGWRVHG
jgi:hypothetical protein